ncbi:hypothetical protein BGZ49_001923 [Haplosporangium sp. Z 27]|nr:hypothetical protein BGZ49_001923 [Haplosporangium sp. Z 27]
MAKKKTTARKTRQSVQSAHSAYPHRSGSSLSNNNSKAPSNASSPSPQPLDLGQGGRRKSVPRRSPSQNDQSKGIVFSFRIQNDSALSMSVNIRKYDQQFGPPEDTEPLKSLTELKVPATVTTSSGENTPMALSHTNGKMISSSSSSSRSSSSGPTFSLSSSSELRVAGERWSSDPTAFKSSNVYDQSRNLLILHTRKPLPITGQSTSSALSEAHPHSFHPYRSQRSSDSRSMSSSSSSSVPSTPALIHSGSCSSSPTSSPSSPTSLHSPTGDSGSAKEDSCSMDSLPLPLDTLSAHSTRFLNVRGMGGATKGRRMQVLVV